MTRRRRKPLGSVSLAVVGATGAVGREVLRVLEERDFPLLGLRPIASPRSDGKMVPFRGEDIPVRVIGDDAFDGIDLAIWDTPDDVAAEWIPRVSDRLVSVDNSTAFRMHEDVPLIVPEVNGDAARTHDGIVASINCTMVTFLMPLAPLHRAAGCRRAIVSTYQSVSGVGVAGVEEFYEQVEKLLPERDAVRRGAVDLPSSPSFTHPIAFNVIPRVGSFREGGITSEEGKVEAEIRKILGAPIEVFTTCVRVPTVVGHAVSAWMEFERPIDAAEARGILAEAPGVRLVDEPEASRYPTPLDAAGADRALVGRVRGDPANTHALGFFSACDNLRKGAALNAVQIAELLLAEGLI